MGTPEAGGSSAGGQGALGRQLRARFEQALASRSPEDNAMMERLIAELRARGIADAAPGPGEVAPDFELPDAHGRLVGLGTMLRRGAVVLVFYRGGWCPYCNIQLRAYQAVLGEIHALGAELLAISPQMPDGSLSTAEQNALGFPVLSDVGNRVASRYGLVFEVPEPVLRFYREQKGFDLAMLNGEAAPNLPVPGCFVIDAEGTVLLASVDADYTRRLEPQAILDALRGQAASAF